MIYFTSDLHFNHDKDFIYAARGYKSIYEHNDEIIRNWNSIITDEDEVWVLGDLCLGGPSTEAIERNKILLSRLNGNIHYLQGNHDTDARMDMYDSLLFTYEGYVQMMKYKKYRFYLSHYPTLCANYDDRGLKSRTINLCGHSHYKDKFADMDKGIIYHVELDAHDMKPVSIEQIISDLKDYFE